MAHLIGSLFALAAAAQTAGIYSAEQAARGKTLYAASCAACHGTALTGGTAPPLAGRALAQRWRPTATLDDVFQLTRKTMPPGAAGSIDDDRLAAIFAYLLERNGFPSGAAALRPDSPELKRTLVASVAPAAPAGPAAEFIQGSGAAPAGGPTQAELNAASGSKRDWLYHTHDYGGSRYVPAEQITAANAKSLRAACVFQVGDTANFQTGPIVYDGTMYITTPRLTVALDATNCQVKWRHTWEPLGQELWSNNRGVAIKDGRLVRATSDGYLVQLNAQTGELIWARRAADTSEGEAFTMAPLLFEDLILIGPAGSENGVSGWVGAFRLSDGAPVWRFKTVPGAREAGSKSWPNPGGIRLGGGGVWTPFSFDPERGELFVAVTNPAPDLAPHTRPGDNLYTNSMVVLDVRTGKLLWYRQMIPNDSHDYDFTQVSPLFSAPVAGRKSRLVATAGKDGMLRTIDRDSREVVYETAVTTVKDSKVPVTTAPSHACPGVLGGVEWNGPAYHPGVNLLYTPVVDWCATFRAEENPKYIPGKTYMGGMVRGDAVARGWITASDASTGEVRWKYASPRPVVAAVTATAGGVVFGGELTGDFLALDARSGDVLYRFNTGGPIGGGIVTYEVGGKQYAAVMSGRPSRFWVDKNPGAPTVLLFALP